MNLFTKTYTTIKFTGLAIALALTCYSATSHACVFGFSHTLELEYFAPSVLDYIEATDKTTLDLPTLIYEAENGTESSED